VALEALDRIEGEGAYANLVLPRLLERSGLDERDRRFVTDLVYGTTRMRRACDHLVDRFLARPPVPRVRNTLRLGAYQLAFADVPPHAAVSETVAVAPRSAQGLVNAVLRRVAEALAAGDTAGATGAAGAAGGTGAVGWPDEATRLSVPDWIVDRLTSDLGRERALAALSTMNRPATAIERDDGYVQDPGSQLVAVAVGAAPGERVLDACAAPGGKATALAAAGARVVAADVRPRRLGLVRANVERLAAAGGTGSIDIVAADATRPPWRAAAFDRVLVDAPCSGLGTLRRRPDLRWRADEAGVERLARLQRDILREAADLVRPGGVLVYSVCTLTRAESVDVDAVLAVERPDLEPLDGVDAPEGPWEPWGRGAILLPQAAGTDGMCLFRYRRVG
jgi:16S rRNA (cytosine967-C5)-methyltransferase